MGFPPTLPLERHTLLPSPCLQGPGHAVTELSVTGKTMTLPQAVRSRPALPSGATCHRMGEPVLCPCRPRCLQGSLGVGAQEGRGEPPACLCSHTGYWGLPMEPDHQAALLTHITSVMQQLPPLAFPPFSASVPGAGIAAQALRPHSPQAPEC